MTVINHILRKDWNNLRPREKIAIKSEFKVNELNQEKFKTLKSKGTQYNKRNVVKEKLTTLKLLREINTNVTKMIIRNLYKYEKEMDWFVKHSKGHQQAIHKLLSLELKIVNEEYWKKLFNNGEVWFYERNKQYSILSHENKKKALYQLYFKNILWNDFQLILKEAMRLNLIRQSDFLPSTKGRNFLKNTAVKI